MKTLLIFAMITFAFVMLNNVFKCIDELERLERKVKELEKDKKVVKNLKNF